METPAISLMGAYPSEKDNRDKVPVLSGIEVGDKHITDISKLRIRMQHKIGKCGGAATAKGTDYLFNFYASDDSSDDFIYLGTKHVIDLNLDEGTSARSVLKFLKKYGVCKRSFFDLNVTKDTVYEDYKKNSIPKEAYDEAEKYKIETYYRVPLDKNMIKMCIKAYGFLIARVEVSDKWFKPSWSAKDILPLKKGDVISGHLIFIYGFDETIENGKMALYYSNSWSELWANKGNGYAFYEDNPPTELWAMTLNKVDEKDTTTISDSVLSQFLSLLKNVVGLKI